MRTRSLTNQLARRLGSPVPTRTGTSALKAGMRSRWLLLVLLLAAGLAGAAAAQQDPPAYAPVPLYLALGDSLAAGVGASDPDGTAYVPLFYEHLRGNPTCNRGAAEVCPAMQLQNLGRPGATTTTLRQSQLPLALDVLQARNGDDNPRNDVEVITIDIGGNDVFALVTVCDAGATPECVQAIQATFATIAQNLASALSQLRAAAGPETEIVVMTYYNALIACDRSAIVPQADLILEGGSGLPVGLNDLIRMTAAQVDASVAETYGLFGPEDLVGGSDCLHPDDSGHQIIADAFAAAEA